MLRIFGLMAVGEDYPVGGFEVAGAGVYLPAPELAMDGAVWCVAEVKSHGHVERCRAFMSVPGPMQSVQRAEFWGVIVAYSPFRLVTWVLITLMVPGLSGGCWIMVV